MLSKQDHVRSIGWLPNGFTADGTQVADPTRFAMIDPEARSARHAEAGGSGRSRSGTDRAVRQCGHGEGRGRKGSDARTQEDCESLLHFVLHFERYSLLALRTMVRSQPAFFTSPVKASRMVQRAIGASRGHSLARSLSAARMRSNRAIFDSTPLKTVIVRPRTSSQVASGSEVFGSGGPVPGLVFGG